jgi:hypothetical protein
MRAWYYEQGGWLMSGDAFNKYRAARQLLLRDTASAEVVYDAFSALRTERRIDVGAREPTERHEPFAAGHEQQY